MANFVTKATKGVPLNLTTSLSMADTKSYLLQVICVGEVRLVQQASLATATECRQKGIYLLPGPGNERELVQEANTVFTLLANDSDAQVIAVEA